MRDVELAVVDLLINDRRVNHHAVNQHHEEPTLVLRGDCIERHRSDVVKRDMNAARGIGLHVDDVPVR